MSFKDALCVETCENSCKWLKCAREILRNNSINGFVYAAALRECLVKGRRKNNNVIIKGPTNCGKSFMLNPLEIIFKAFVNPTSTRYAWVGLDEAEVAYLNDFRWSSECIAWSDFLLLLEGQTVHLPRPKNQFATDLLVSRENTMPFFATSKSAIEYVGKYNNRDDRESDMMASRWRMFTFDKRIASPQHFDPCPRCFAELLALGIEEDGNN